MKSKENSSKDSGAFHFSDKGHLPSSKKEGAHDQGKHESSLKEQGAHTPKNKTLVHTEDANTHNGRPHPPATRLVDSKALTHNAYPGKLRKSDNV